MNFDLARDHKFGLRYRQKDLLTYLLTYRVCRKVCHASLVYNWIAVYLADDELMSDKHKEQLSTNRAKIVANMNPDDVLNRLQSRKVMNARDVSRIRDKTQIDDQVELLLDTLMRKPDRAFGEFINALVDTDQKHVAKLIATGLRHVFLARDVIYTSPAYATMSVSVCLCIVVTACNGSRISLHSWIDGCLCYLLTTPHPDRRMG